MSRRIIAWNRTHNHSLPTKPILPPAPQVVVPSASDITAAIFQAPRPKVLPVAWAYLGLHFEKEVDELVVCSDYLELRWRDEGGEVKVGLGDIQAVKVSTLGTT